MYTILLNNQLTADVIMKIGSSQSFSAKTTRWSSVQSPCWLMFVGSLFNIYIFQPAQRSSRRGRSINSNHVYIYIHMYISVGHYHHP